MSSSAEPTPLDVPVTTPDGEQIMREVLRQYERVNPRDHQDTEAHLGERTLDVLADYARSLTVRNHDDPLPRMIAPPKTLLGMPVRADDTLPFGEVRFITENGQERAMRRILAEGKSIYVVKMLPPALPPVPDPTLCALIRHWRRKLRSWPGRKR